MTVPDRRDLFPVTRNLAYLNHAGVAPISAPVARAIRAATDECLAWGAHRYDRLLRGVADARRSAARLLDTAPSTIAFVKNTSEGVALVAEGLGLGRGDAVVVPEGEFPANVYPWLNLGRHGVRVHRVPMRDGRIALDAYRAALDLPGVRVLAVSAVAFETGFRNDLAALGQLCRDRDVFFFVDAIQALGCLPLAPAGCGIHALAADAHKWLLGPEGVGLLYVAPDAVDRLHPVVVGWKSVREPLAFDRIRFDLRPDAGKFEPGSLPVIALHGLGAAVDLLLEVGVDRIWRRVGQLTARAREALSGRGYTILSSPEPAEQSGIVAFAPRTGPGGLARRLQDRGVFAAARGGGLRISPHFYNTDSEIDDFLHALDEEDRTGREAAP